MQRDKNRSRHARMPRFGHWACTFLVVFALLPVVGLSQPFAVSTDEHTYYYKIQIKENANHYMVPEGVRDAGDSWDYVTTYDVDGDYMVWYLEFAQTVGGVDYYYIVNALSGKYLKCKTPNNNQQVLKALNTEPLPASGTN